MKEATKTLPRISQPAWFRHRALKRGYPHFPHYGRLTTKGERARIQKKRATLHHRPPKSGHILLIFSAIFSPYLQKPSTRSPRRRLRTWPQRLRSPSPPPRPRPGPTATRRWTTSPRYVRISRICVFLGARQSKGVAGGHAYAELLPRAFNRRPPRPPPPGSSVIVVCLSHSRYHPRFSGSLLLSFSIPRLRSAPLPGAPAPFGPIRRCSVTLVDSLRVPIHRNWSGLDPPLCCVGVKVGPGPMMCRDGNNQQAAGWLGLTWLLMLQPKT